MFLKNYHLTFLFMLFISTIIAVSSNSWFTAWLGLEINLMSMTPLMLISLSPKATEAAIKYFLTQAMASIILIFSISLNFLLQETVNMETMEYLITISLVMKAGLAPLHFWFPQVIFNLKWMQCILIFTWQKVAPLLLLTCVSLKIVYFIAATSAVTGAMSGYNQTLTKMMMTYSSISHSGWMIMSCFSSLNNLIFYFFIYCILSSAIVLFFFSNQTKKVSQIFSEKTSSSNKVILSMNMLSLGGLPPLLGFMAKLSIFIHAIKNIILSLFIPLIFSSVVSLYFYTRLIYTNLMNSSKSMNFVSTENKKPLFLLFIVSFIMNLMAPMILIFF